VSIVYSTVQYSITAQFFTFNFISSVRAGYAAGMHRAYSVDQHRRPLWFAYIPE